MVVVFEMPSEKPTNKTKWNEEIMAFKFFIHACLKLLR